MTRFASRGWLVAILTFLPIFTFTRVCERRAIGRRADLDLQRRRWRTAALSLSLSLSLSLYIYIYIYISLSS